jgi:hypothetical protein
MEGSFRWKARIWPDEENLNEEVQGAGTARNEFLAHGRFIHINWEGQAMGDPWSGSHILGYDSGHGSPEGMRGIKEVHINRYGNFGVGKTDYDGSSNTIEIHGETHECSRGVEKYRSVFTVVSDDEFRLDVYMTGKNGQESKAREIVFTRA